MKKTPRRAAVALVTISLHAALGLSLAWALRSPASPLAASSIRVQLIDAPARAPSPVAQLAVPVPRLTPPSMPALEAPLITLAAPAAGPTPAPVSVASPAVAIAAAAVAPPPFAEPDYQAALPPSRQCTEQTVARHYPPLLRERGVEGRVLLRVRVDERGRAAEVLVSRGSGWRLLDEAAQRLTQDCRFVPAHRGGHALMSWVEYPVSFALN
ncbi:energy transducer TonB [Burkholderiaceae bacterium UC74_6]